MIQNDTLFRRTRKEANLTLAQASELSLISEAYLSQLERSIRKPSVDVILRLAKLYNVPADELMLSAGLIPEWFMKELKLNPDSAILAGKDKFHKYNGANL